MTVYDDAEPTTLLHLLSELSDREPTRFRYLGGRQQDEMTAHLFEISVEALGDPSPLEIWADNEGGEIVNLYELAMLSTLLELACQDHAWEVEMVMNGLYDMADYAFDIWDGHGNHLGSGSDSSREFAFLSAYLEAIMGQKTAKAMSA